MMAGPNNKRQIGDSVRGGPFKKATKQREYHSDSDEDELQLEKLPSPSLEPQGAKEEDEETQKTQQETNLLIETHPDQKKAANDQFESSADDDEDGFSGSDASESGDEALDPSKPRVKSTSKRNDPSIFATSLSKILGSKLSTAKRADPVLSRSADAAEASRQAADSALDARARRALRDAKRAALEKGRVRDVLAPATAVAAAAPADGPDVPGGAEARTVEVVETAEQVRERERRLRRVAQRGVVRLFNAVRAAQVKAAEAERATRAEGVLGMERRKEKVTEMTKQGFLELLASSGGGLKKGGVEEA
jgi:hypothetical protein